VSEHDVSRRDFLKRGAALGGAVMWVTPVVQIVGMRPAFAQVASPACNVWYAAKIERSDDPPGWVCLMAGEGAQDCLNLSDIESDEGLGTGTIQEGCHKIVSVIVAPENALNKDWVVVLDEGCQFVEESDRCTWKSGDECEQGVCTYDHATRTLTFHAGNQDISHIEFAFCCED
jgi:hypothetical protein